MRKTLLAALVGAMLLAPLHAQQAAQVPPAATAPSAPLPDDGIRTEATVVVTGGIHVDAIQPGEIRTVLHLVDRLTDRLIELLAPGQAAF